MMSSTSIRARIAGIGSYVPDRILTNYDLEEMVETSDEWIVTRTGIRTRHIVDEGVSTSDIGLMAAKHALSDAGVEPEEVDLIVVATVTPDMPFPSTACVIQSKIGAVNAFAFDISAGCTGFIYALSVASQYIESGSCKKVLVIGAETLSKVTNWKDRRTCILFGDGAGAALLVPTKSEKGIIATYLGSDGSGEDMLKIPAGGSRMPASEETLSQGLHYIHMEGNEVFKFAVKALGDATLRVLDKVGLSKEDIHWFIPHQANIRIMEAAARRLDVSLERIVMNLDKYGNTSSASIPIALDEAVRDGRIKPGELLDLVGFGAGLTWGASLIRWG